MNDFKKGMYSPRDALYEILSAASCFVHFVTYGISINILKDFTEKTKQNVIIRGLIANVKDQQTKQLEDLQQKLSLKRLAFHLYSESGFQRKTNEYPPHQKLIIVDGLLAFVSSANLTNAGWKKLNNRREFLDIVTNISKVQSLHNQLFSSIWAEDKPGNAISYGRVQPLEKTWPSDLPVKIVGTEDGRITENGSSYQIFTNFEEAQSIFPELDPYKNTENFTMAFYDTINGNIQCMRFETWNHYNLMSG